MKRIFMSLAGALMFLAASGCNTVEGFGRDVESTGEAIEDAGGDN